MQQISDRYNHRWKLGQSRYLYSMQLSTWCSTCELHFLAIEVAFPSGSEDAVFLDLRANARCVLSRVCSNGFVIISRSRKVSFSLFANSQACQWRGVVAFQLFVLACSFSLQYRVRIFPCYPLAQAGACHIHMGNFIYARRRWLSKHGLSGHGRQTSTS